MKRVRGLNLLRLASWGLLSWGCGGATPKQPEASLQEPPVPEVTAAELFERGPHAVGFRTTTVTYDPVGPADARSLALRIWYPAVAGSEGPADYQVGGIVAVPSEGALAEPEPARGGSRSPFIRMGGEGLLAYPYAELFASHGWVVVAANHTGNTAIDNIRKKLDPFATVVVNRPHDVSAVIDWVASDLSRDLPGLVADTDAVFLFGHSIGGFTTFAGAGVDLDVVSLAADCTEPNCAIYADPEVARALTSFGDPRVVAIAPQAPALVASYQLGALAALEVPTLLQSGRRDVTLRDEEQARPAWAGLDHPSDLWVELPEGGHLSFITLCDDLDPRLMEGFQANARDNGCGPDFVPVAQAVRALAAYLLGFARLHVLGEEGWRPLLSGEPLDPAVVVTTR
ncbi:MAG: hypothetical protein R3B72_36515 [Polyangiaceae bacterium]